ncbi:MAG: SDR family oxidoreductase [Geminicoccaceae bacterium]
MTKRALILGASGIIGRTLAEELLTAGDWTVLGVARRAGQVPAGVQPIAVDLRDEAAVRAALAGTSPTHLFITTWLRQANEKENCAVNGAMVRNALAALEGSRDLGHVALVTGLKHYLGPFEHFAKNKPVTPFREEQPRVPLENFYYVQEDAVFEAAAKQGFGWSVHRPHTLIGYAVGNAMNMGSTLAAYAAICKETGQPFVFPGSPEQWAGVSDVTDGRILARHLHWAASTPAARNEAFNVVNGEVFRWNWLWPRLAALYGVPAADYPGRATPLVEQMAGAAPVWDRIVRKYGLAANAIDVVASWWHSDADLGRPVECFTDMSKSRRLGFMDYQETTESFRYVYERLKAERIVP